MSGTLPIPPSIHPVAPFPGVPTILDAVAVPVLLLSDQWVCVRANHAAAEAFGTDPVGRDLAQLLIGADSALRRLRDGRTRSGGSAGAGGAGGAGGVGGSGSEAGPFSMRGVQLSRSGEHPSAAERPTLVDLDIMPLPRTENAPTDQPAGPASPRIWALATMVDVSARSAAEGELVRLRASLAEAERASQRLQSLQAELVQEGEKGLEMIGASGALQRVRDQVARVAPTDTTVLVHGETGSGKELVARSIHAGSRRNGSAFIAVNCAALPESLIESELFGHEKGAFTGADRRRLGKFELADGGTLFLDEIAELPLQAQAKLLRVIQESAFERVGGAETVHVNVRLLAATHRDLARQVERGRFREDVFYRLNVFRIEVPPLRDRREDLRALAAHLHERIARRMGKPVLRISDPSLRRIMAYPWPGNVRELANAVERATLLADGPELDIELPESPLTALSDGGSSMPRSGGAGGPGGGTGAGGGGGSGAGGGAGSPTRDILLDLTLEQLQRLQITHALESCGYRVFGPSGAAQRLDINANTLLSRMDKFGIPRPRIMKQGR